MACTRKRLLFHALPGKKSVRSSVRRAVLRPLDIPQLQHPRVVVRRPPLPPGFPPPATCVPKPDYSDPRKSVREILAAMLVYISGDRDARMVWELRLFRDQVVLRYGVILVGWPPAVPFWQLSKKGGPTAEQMRDLLDLLTANPPQLYFTRATEEQLRVARLAAGGIPPSTLRPEALPFPNLGHSDIAQRHMLYGHDGNPMTHHHVCDGLTSAKATGEELRGGSIDADTDSISEFTDEE
ncbi:hypothetical protein L226DRAFT_616466 [Lentinus tigrinus ALCF2SS1-7]|uniref:Uncharacterized protein n=1 Tax=Lentinus tigrinus ALCF2SS1-6 TaxID=1328759 RepID=A0A5C2RPI5_9APHY|nr:hypothetical protein L227DRAFT_658448 [Lentinus tigrinus ALCF2SS1-6]RPD70070.1 hypothetical protein L226DRAFT_616466 [Lentinus tigrinus ALCF2SS1-7]